MLNAMVQKRIQGLGLHHDASIQAALHIQRDVSKVEVGQWAVGDGGASFGQQRQFSVREGDPVRHDCPLSQQACSLVHLGVPAIHLQTRYSIAGLFAWTQCSP